MRLVEARRKLLVVFCLLSVWLPFASAQVSESVDWKSFLSREDLVWGQLPPQWDAGAFTGNGMLGLMIFHNLWRESIEFHVGRVDVTDHRHAPDRQTSAFVRGASVHSDLPRLDIGKLELHPAGKILSGSMRQILWDAEVDGRVVTDKGVITFRAITHSGKDVDWIEVISTEKDEKGVALPYRWEFVPTSGQAPRYLFRPTEPRWKDYVENPPWRSETVNGVAVFVQPLLAGGDYATALMEKKTGTQSSDLYVSIANAVPKADLSGPLAVKTVQDASKEDVPSFLASHRAWWHAFYPKAFLSIPDPQLESFYWIQMYKLASATRQGGPLIDDQGPWMRLNMWPYATWDLNVELTYWPVYAGNRLELGTSMTQMVDRYFDAMLAAESTRNIGDLSWVLNNYWQQLAYAGDEQGLSKQWLPKAVAQMEKYEAILKPGPDGRLHLDPTQSPEWEPLDGTDPNKVSFADASYNVALCRWLVAEVVRTSEKNHLHADELPAWREMQAKLPDFAVDKDGIMIGPTQPVDNSHRHFSHLVGLYPLHLFDTSNPQQREMLLRTVDHWQTILGGKRLAGYSMTGAAEFSATLGDGDATARYLHLFLANARGGGKVVPNTMYVEGANPVIETPLSAASATQDMLLQSWGGRVQVFPAVPKEWQEASFYHLRAIGGILVSGVREQGRTRWVGLECDADRRVIVHVPDWTGGVHATDGGTVESLGAGDYAVQLKAGHEVIVSNSADKGAFQVKPVGQPADAANPFGLRANQVYVPFPELKEDH